MNTNPPSSYGFHHHHQPHHYPSSLSVPSFDHHYYHHQPHYTHTHQTPHQPYYPAPAVPTFSPFSTTRPPDSSSSYYPTLETSSFSQIQHQLPSDLATAAQLSYEYYRYQNPSTMAATHTAQPIIPFPQPKTPITTPTITMSTRSNKLRKQYFRRTRAKPYDRPPPTLRPSFAVQESHFLTPITFLSDLGIPATTVTEIAAPPLEDKRMSSEDRFQVLVQRLSVLIDEKLGFQLKQQNDSNRLSSNRRSSDPKGKTESFIQKKSFKQSHHVTIHHFVELHPADCIVADFMYPWVHDVANTLHIPRLTFSGFSLFAETAMEPVKANPEIHSGTGPFVIPDFPHQITMCARPPKLLRFLESLLDPKIKSHALTVNHFKELDGEEYIEHYEKITGHKAWHFGPACLIQETDQQKAQRGQESVLSNDACLSWLDSKPSNSGVYISFGSVYHFPDEQLYEIACGVEAAGQEFVWVVPEKKGKEISYTNGSQLSPAYKAIALQLTTNLISKITNGFSYCFSRWLNASPLDCSLNVQSGPSVFFKLDEAIEFAGPTTVAVQGHAPASFSLPVTTLHIFHSKKINLSHSLPHVTWLFPIHPFYKTTNTLLPHDPTLFLFPIFQRSLFSLPPMCLLTHFSPHVTPHPFNPTHLIFQSPFYFLFTLSHVTPSIDSTNIYLTSLLYPTQLTP